MRDRRQQRKFQPAFLFTAACLFAAGAAAQPLGTAFTYQGRLTDGGQPATGLYDLQVCLFDSTTNPVPIACAPDFADVPVENGVFTIALDFGGAPFAGQQRHLELRVRPGAATGGYTILAPRQPVRATPEALRASAASVAPWSGLTGVPAGFADGIDNDSGGTVTSVVAGTGLAGGTITGSGTIGIANGGVGSLQLADGGVAAVDVAPDSLGAGQIATNGIGAAELADNAVDTSAVQNLAITQTKIATGAVGLAQIDTSQVQARISGTCAIGEYFRGVNVDGSVACEVVPGVASLAVVDDPPVNNVDEPSLAIGADGLPVMSYWDSTDGDLKFARCVDAACRRPAQVRVLDATGLTGRYNAIAIGSGGLPVVSYVSTSTLELRLARCLDAACANVDLRTLDTGVEQERTAIVVPPGDLQPVVAYRRSGQLHLIRCANPTCSSTQARVLVDPAVANSGSPSMAVGGDGLPVIAYRDGTNAALRFARCANADCSSRSTVTVDDPANQVGSNNSVTVGPDGLAVVSYRDDSTGTLKFARCGDANCSSNNTISGVAAAGNNVITTRVAVGDDGLPAVALVEGGGGPGSGLRVLRCGNGACTAANTVATLVFGNNSGGPGTPGAPSLAIGADGLPMLAYRTFNGFETNVRLAKCGSRSCQ